MTALSIIKLKIVHTIMKIYRKDITVKVVERDSQGITLRIRAEKLSYSLFKNLSPQSLGYLTEEETGKLQELEEVEVTKEARLLNT